MAKWSYEAIRTPEGVQAFVVIQNGTDVTKRHPLPHIVKHSPTGFEMGYGGSGPADLAYSILTHWFLSYKFSREEAEELAWTYHQRFKFRFIAPERERLCIADSVISEWWIEQAIADEEAQKAQKGGQA